MDEDLRGIHLWIDGLSTRKGDTIYLQIFDWPDDGKLRVPLNNEIKQASLLGPAGREVLKTSREPGRIIVQLPAKAPDAVANVVALKIEGEPQTDYVSVLLNKPVNASTEQKSAAAAVDSDDRSYWRNSENTAWLEINAGKPVTVATMRVSLVLNPIKNGVIEYKDGDKWKPILTGLKFNRDCNVRSFPPVTAQVFRLNILEADKPVQINNLEMYPPL